MKLTKKSDYALRAAYYLAKQPEGKIASIGEIAEKQAVPREFLAKILKELTAAKILRSFHGIKGGYSLARSPSEISFLDIIQAVEGPIMLNQCCQENMGCCEMSATCEMKVFWRKQQDVYVGGLARETLDRYR